MCFVTSLLPSPPPSSSWAGVNLMQVDSRDHVRSFEEVDAVSIFCYQEKIEGQPPAFLQCGEFVYPLVPGCSPVLKGSDALYMFPELRGEGGRGLGWGVARCW